MTPKRLSRYVIFEFTKIFLVTLASMTALMLLVGVVQEAIRESLTPLTILKLIPYAVPNALCFAIPGTVLFAVCNVLGRMSAGNEVIAIKSLGISPLVIIRPLIIVAFLLSLVTVVLNDFAVSWGRQGIYRVVLHSVQNTIYAKLNADKSYRRGNVSMAVQAVEGLDLIGVVVEVHQNDDQKPYMMTAQKARLEVDIEQNVLVIMTENAVIEGDEMLMTIEQDRYQLPLEDVTKKRDKSQSPSNLPMRLLTSELRNQKEEIEHQKEEMAITAAIQSLSGDLVGLTDVHWKMAERKLEKSIFRKHRLRSEPWRRWANGFSCLFFVIVGAPLAIRLHRADFWTIFAMCFVPILVIYYPILMAGVEYAKAGRLPPYVVWTGNLVMLAVGVYLVRHLRRH